MDNKLPLRALLLSLCCWAALTDAGGNRRNPLGIHESGEEQESEKDPTFAGGALEWRMRTLRDPNGVAPAGTHRALLGAAAAQRIDDHCCGLDRRRDVERGGSGHVHDGRGRVGGPRSIEPRRHAPRNRALRARHPHDTIGLRVRGFVGLGL